jgi:hypothetical protein
MGSVSCIKRPRLTGLFRLNPAPNADTSLNRVMSFQATF